MVLNRKYRRVTAEAIAKELVKWLKTLDAKDSISVVQSSDAFLVVRRVIKESNNE